MSNFDRALSEVGELSLEVLTTTHWPWELAEQLGQSATSPDLQPTASAITLSLGEGLWHWTIDIFTSAMLSPVRLGMPSDGMGVVW